MATGAIGAFAMALGVALGAFGAHSLRDRLDAYSMSVYEKAVFYHFIHALGLLAVGLMARSGFLAPNLAARVGLLLLAGIVLFSGSLYLLAITGTRWLGAVTPLGGLAFILAWLLLGWYLLPQR